MAKRQTGWIVAGSLVVVFGMGSLALHEHRVTQGSKLAPEARDGFRGFASRPFSRSGAESASPERPPAPPESAEMVAQQVTAVMGRWRTAILLKDAPSVIALDLTLRQRPARFAAALGQSAATDENERVRAFSTRVLGKLKDPAEKPLFEQLLSDKSQYVRQNAAWALGELGAASESAVAELQKASRRDPATEVRAAAKDALGKI